MKGVIENKIFKSIIKSLVYVFIGQTYPGRDEGWAKVSHGLITPLKHFF